MMCPINSYFRANIVAISLAIVYVGRKIHVVYRVKDEDRALLGEGAHRAINRRKLPIMLLPQIGR